MTKEKILKAVKICAVVLWIALMLFPTIYTETNKVTLVQKDTRYIVETDSYEFTLTCDRDIVSGEVTFGFYDNDLNSLSTYKTEFKQDANKKVVVVIASDSIPDEVAEYKVEEMYVKSSTAKTIEWILYPISCVYAVLLIALLRITILSYDYKGKKVEVYAGLRNHRISVDGEVLAEEKKVFFLNPITLQVAIDGGTKLYAQILANHKISLYTKEAEVKEEESKIVAEETNENVFEVKDAKEDIKKVPQGYFEEENEAKEETEETEE